MTNREKLIYLDNNATTPCAPEVLDAMLPFFGKEYGNPSSPHLMGRRAAAAVEQAREQVAELIGCDASEIIFTTGATESNNMVLHGLQGEREGRNTVVTSPIEHKAVLCPCDQLSDMGFSVLKVQVDSRGRICPASAEELISDHTLLVSIQSANNEVGTVQPIREIARIAHSRGALVHSDAAQALGKIPFDVRDMDIDFASFSAHKLYGPKGVGALYVRGRPTSYKLTPSFTGGGQEGGLRPGTLNVPGIVGLGLASQLATSHLEDDIVRIGKIRDALEAQILRELPDVRLNGNHVARLPGTTSITIPDVSADVLIANAPEVCISAGSACTSGAVSPSHVLLAMGLSRRDAECTIRIGVGRYTTLEEIGVAVRTITGAVLNLRAQMR